VLFSHSFRSIKTTSSGLFKDRGSKFISYAFPVSSEDDIKQHLLALKKEHVSARHFCYAWRLGAGGQAWRTNDDGEPNNSAGKPIYAQILSKDLTNVLIVVVRYFGGTLLGVGGLVNAYKSAAAEAILNAEITEEFIYFQYNLIFDVHDANYALRILRELNAKIISEEYTEHYTLIFNIKRSLSEVLEEKLKPIYNAKLTYLKTL
jgi:uncharacterized YigZ family protein